MSSHPSTWTRPSGDAHIRDFIAQYAGKLQGLRDGEKVEFEFTNQGWIIIGKVSVVRRKKLFAVSLPGFQKVVPFKNPLVLAALIEGYLHSSRTHVPEPKKMLRVVISPNTFSVHAVPLENSTDALCMPNRERLREAIMEYDQIKEQKPSGGVLTQKPAAAH